MYCMRLCILMISFCSLSTSHYLMKILVAVKLFIPYQRSFMTWAPGYPKVWILVSKESGISRSKDKTARKYDLQEGNDMKFLTLAYQLEHLWKKAFLALIDPQKIYIQKDRDIDLDMSRKVEDISTYPVIVRVLILFVLFYVKSPNNAI